MPSLVTSRTRFHTEGTDGWCYCAGMLGTGGGGVEEGRTGWLSEQRKPLDFGSGQRMRKEKSVLQRELEYTLLLLKTRVSLLQPRPESAKCFPSM